MRKQRLWLVFLVQTISILFHERFFIEYEMNFDEFIRPNYCDFIIANLFLKVNSEKNRRNLRR